MIFFGDTIWYTKLENIMAMKPTKTCARIICTAVHIKFGVRRIAEFLHEKWCSSCRINHLMESMSRENEEVAIKADKLSYGAIHNCFYFFSQNNYTIDQSIISKSCTQDLKKISNFSWNSRVSLVDLLLFSYYRRLKRKQTRYNERNTVQFRNKTKEQHDNFTTVPIGYIGRWEKESP